MATPGQPTRRDKTRPSDFVHTHKHAHAAQDGPPATLPWGAWCTISLFLSNEFGLWRRADFPARDANRESLPLEFMVYDHGGGYCAPSAAAGVEVEALSSEEEDEDGGGREGIVALRRHTSCRVRCRLRFHPLSDSDAVPTTVHVRIGLPPSLLSREVLPVISLPIRLVVSPAPSPTAPGSGNGEQDQDIDARLGIKGCRTIYLPALGRALLCAESPGQAGIAGKVCPCWIGLTMYIHVCDMCFATQPLLHSDVHTGMGRWPRPDPLPGEPARGHCSAKDLY